MHCIKILLLLLLLLLELSVEEFDVRKSHSLLSVRLCLSLTLTVSGLIRGVTDLDEI